MHFPKTHPNKLTVWVVTLNLFTIASSMLAFASKHGSQLRRACWLSPGRALGLGPGCAGVSTRSGPAPPGPAIPNIPSSMQPILGRLLGISEVADGGPKLCSSVGGGELLLAHMSSGEEDPGKSGYKGASDMHQSTFEFFSTPVCAHELF